MTPNQIMMVIFMLGLEVVDSPQPETTTWIGKTICPLFHYHNGLECIECPPNCEKCESNTSCTECDEGYFGRVCEKKCLCGEPGKCDKELGSCRHGCGDGRYNTKENRTCRPCPGCGTCKKCKQNTGNCLQCHDNYFLHDGKCKRCPPVCKLCVTDSKCTECIESFFLLDGRCESCMLGCQLCNTSNNCVLCNKESVALFDGLCLDICPAKNPLKIIPSNNSTCEEHNSSYNYTVSGFCQQHSKEFPFAKYMCKYQYNRSSREGNCSVQEMKLHDLSRNQGETQQTNCQESCSFLPWMFIVICCSIVLVIIIIIFIMMKRGCIILRVPACCRRQNGNNNGEIEFAHMMNEKP